MMKPREFFVGISDGTTAHVAAERKWSTDYHLIDKSAYDKAVAALKRAKSRNHDMDMAIGIGEINFAQEILRHQKSELEAVLKELGDQE